MLAPTAEMWRAMSLFIRSSYWLSLIRRCCQASAVIVSCKEIDLDCDRLLGGAFVLLPEQQRSYGNEPMKGSVFFATAEDRFGSKREELDVSNSSPHDPNDRTLFGMCEKFRRRANARSRCAPARCAGP